MTDWEFERTRLSPAQLKEQSIINYYEQMITRGIAPATRTTIIINYREDIVVEDNLWICMDAAIDWEEDWEEQRMKFEAYEGFVEWLPLQL